MKSMKWGIVTNNFQINAKSEKINNSSFYKNMRNNCCGVIANGFYEWDKEKKVLTCWVSHPDTSKPLEVKIKL